MGSGHRQLGGEKGTGEESRSGQLDAQSVAHFCRIERRDPDGTAGSELTRRDHWVGTNSASAVLIQNVQFQNTTTY